VKRLGIFAKTFTRHSFPEVLEAVTAHGLRCIQFNFACVGLPSMPEVIAPEIIEQVRRACDARAVEIAGVSGTFNMAHPDAARRADGLRRLEVLAPAAQQLGCNFVSLCTGTRDPEDMWREHPENNSPEAWRDLLRSMETAIAIAERYDVVLGVEPEIGNVVSSAAKARRLLDELRAPRVKIIIDPANLFRREEISTELNVHSSGRDVRAPMRRRIAETFELLHGDIHMAHAKELALDGSLGGLPPGRGVIDWEFYSARLQEMRFSGALILHGLPEESVGEAVEFLRGIRAQQEIEIRGRDVRAPGN
jgi:sugar phosphate isomerase/epimerase